MPEVDALGSAVVHAIELQHRVHLAYASFQTVCGTQPGMYFQQSYLVSEAHDVEGGVFGSVGFVVRDPRKGRPECRGLPLSQLP